MPDTTFDIAHNITQLTQTIRTLEKQYARAPHSVQLVAVSKTHPAAAIRDALQAGQQHFGENYLQEALEKQQALAELALNWHFIGPIQSNKTRDIATHFSWVHSVDREKIARRLNDQRDPQLAPLNILLQVNISAESSKAGISPADLPALAASVDALPRLRLRGLMAIPAPCDDFALQRRTFQRLAELRNSLLAAGRHDCQELSMGMSADYEAAIAEGATMIRIGTQIFGRR